MREKARDLIYLDTGRYISLDNLRTLYCGIAIVPFFMIIMSIVSINKFGISYKSLFPIVSFGVWSTFYWIFVLVIQNKREKKFELRFLVNGISGVLLSSLFVVFFVSFDITSDTPLLSLNLLLNMLAVYLLFSAIYILVIIFCVHRGVFALINKKSKFKKSWTILTFFTALFPCSGMIGMYTSQLIRFNQNINTHPFWIAIFSSLLIFLPVLAHINFVQFYYCKKYGIDCDEHGNTTSSELIGKSKSNNKANKNNSNRKAVHVFLKMIIGIMGVLVSFFVIFLIIGFIKSMT